MFLFITRKSCQRHCVCVSLSFENLSLHALLSQLSRFNFHTKTSFTPIHLSSSFIRETFQTIVPYTQSHSMALSSAIIAIHAFTILFLVSIIFIGFRFIHHVHARNTKTSVSHSSSSPHASFLILFPLLFFSCFSFNDPHQLTD